MTLVYCLLMCVASFLIFSELEAAGGKSFALRLIESSIDKVDAIDAVSYTHLDVYKRQAGA